LPSNCTRDSRQGIVNSHADAASSGVPARRRESVLSASAWRRKDLGHAIAVSPLVRPPGNIETVKLRDGSKVVILWSLVLLFWLMRSGVIPADPDFYDD